MSITLIDSTSDSLTVSWPSSPNATHYILQYRKATEDSQFETLSDKLTSTQARKRNLSDTDGVGFLFRVAPNDKEDSWTTHAEPFSLLSGEEETKRMEAPTATLAGSNLAARVAWKSRPSGSYELQMRENEGGAAWETIAPSLVSTEVRKKNLRSKNGYQFRVRSSPEEPFSPPSEPFVALGLSDGMKNLFNYLEDKKILKQSNQPAVPLEEALGGKEFVLLYASAHWCGPCRQFSPQLTRWYNSLGPNKTIEIVFLSADHDESSFQSYYSSMPWAAIPFDDDGRESLMGHIRVQGIPRLAVLDARTGRIIEDNAIGKPLDIQRWRKLAGH